MLEYRTNPSKIMKAGGGNSNEDPSKFFIYSGIDGVQYLVELANFNNTAFPSENSYEMYYPGKYGYEHVGYKTVNANYGDPVLGDSIGFNYKKKLRENAIKTLTEFRKVGTILKSDDYENIIKNSTNENSIMSKEEAEQGLRSASLFHDSIRIYLATGYVMNSISGINIKVSVPITRALRFFNDVPDMSQNEGSKYVKTSFKRVDSKLYLLNYYLPKEMLWQKDTMGNSILHWLPSPLYMNSRFYDRYIEVKFPAPRSLYLNRNLDTMDPTDIMSAYKDYIKTLGIDYVYSEEVKKDEIVYYHGIPEQNTIINVEVSTVSPDYLDLIDNDSNNYYECTFSVDSPKEISLSGISMSNFLNAQMYEDLTNGYIVYQPVWGDPTETDNLEPMDISHMLQIETGVIPMVDFADYDTLNDGIDDFIETYGEEAYKWIIINELSATYYYKYIIDPDDVNEAIEPYTEYFTNTIDYTGKSDRHGEFWKSYYIPHIKPRANMTCDYIALKYTLHLYNRMNNRDIVKTSSVIIDNPMAYETQMINISPIVNYKIVNKIVKNQTSIQATSVTGTKQPEVIERNIKSYYTNSDIIVKQNGTQMVEVDSAVSLLLYRKSHNYRFSIYKQQSDGSRIPFDMSGFQEYKLTFPVLNSSATLSTKNLEIYPVTNSVDTNFGTGQLMFYITEDQVKKIMAVPVSERYFQLMTRTQNGQDESVLFEGIVQYRS